MSTFFDSFEAPKNEPSNEEKQQLPDKVPEALPGVSDLQQLPVHHAPAFSPNYLFYLLAILGLIGLTLLLYFVAEWSGPRIVWGSLLPAGLGFVTYRYMEAPYRDIRFRQLAAIIGFGLVGLLIVIYHLLIPLLNSNQPVHLYLLAIIAALAAVSWFFYKERQHYRALAVGLLAMLLLIATLSFWHKWTGRYHDTNTGDSWSKYSVF